MITKDRTVQIIALLLIIGASFSFSAFKMVEAGRSTDGGQTQILETTAFGEQLVAELRPQFQGSFEYTVNNTALFTLSTTSNATITQDSGMAVLQTSTNSNEVANFKSKQHAKYKPGMGGVIRFTSLFTSPIASTTQLIGIMDATSTTASFKNGYAVGYVGTGFGFHVWANSGTTTIAQADWDDPMDGTGDSGMKLDHTKLNIFYIQYQYLGAGAINLFVESDRTGNPVLAHRINYANKNVTPSVHNPNFHFTMEVDNGITTSNMIIKSSSYAYFIEGITSFIELHQPQFSSDVLSTTTVTTEVPIFTLRNKSTYVGKENFIDIILEHYGGSIEANSANNLGDIRLIKNATLDGNESYSDINSRNSIMEVDTTASTVTGGTTIINIPLAGKNDKIVENVLNLKIILNPGETITCAGTSANSATMNCQMLWQELF